MGRPRKPTNILELKGSIKKDPLRFKDRENEPQNVNPVGDPPEYLSDEVKAAWYQIVNESIDGVLGEADRIAIEMCAGLYVKLRSPPSDDGKPIATAQDHTQFFRYLTQFGMVPADRSKISIPKKKPVNKFDDD